MSAFDKHCYCQVSASEETANLCWRLIAALEDHFVGYEDLVSSLRDTAIRLEVESEDCLKKD